MTATGTGLRTICLVVIPTIDQDAAIAFYESIGFEKRTDVPFGDKYRWVEVYPPEGNTGVALAPPPQGQDVTPSSTGVTLQCDDIDAAHASMVELGVDADDVMRMGDPIPPMFWFRDPSGHSLMVVQT